MLILPAFPGVIAVLKTSTSYSRPSFVTRSGRRIELTPTGYKLLARLMRDAPRIVSRHALEEAVWGDEPPDSDALRSHLHVLRQAIDRPFGEPMLVTVPGFGYRLVDPRDGAAGAA